MILKGFSVVLASIALSHFMSFMRDRSVMKKATAEDLNWLQIQKKLKSKEIGAFEEELRSQYSPFWLTALATLPLFGFLGGLGLIAVGVWEIEAIWTRFTIIYLLLGLIVTVIHLKRGHVGAKGFGATFMFGLVGWPIFVYMHINLWVWRRRFEGR